MDEIKKIHLENEKQNEELIKNTTIGNFLLKNHDDIFNNMDLYANDMASNSFKRFMMLNSESDGIDLVFKIGGNKIYFDEEFKIFIKKINEYFIKIEMNDNYEKNDETELLEKMIYDKFRLMLEKIIF